MNNEILFDEIPGEFPAQMTSNALNISIWWRHHAGVDLVKSEGCCNIGYSSSIEKTC